MPSRALALAAAAAALSAALCVGAQAAPMCLKPGSLGPDVPDCSAYRDGPDAKTAVGDNLLAIAGQASVENFEEREAIDAAGPMQLQLGKAAAAKGKAATSRAAALAAFGVTPAPDAPDGPSLRTVDAQYDAIAQDIVKGTGNVFQSLGQTARASAAGAIAGVPPLTPAARAQAAAAGFSSPASLAAAAAPGSSAAARQPAEAGRQQTSIGQLSAITDPGRQVFDQEASGMAEDVSADGAVAAPRAPTVRQCTPLHPCDKAN